MDKYRNYLLGKGFSENTINSYLFAVRQLRERLGNAWTDQELLNHKDWLATTFAAKTANLRITAINSYLDFTNYDGIRLKSLRIQQKPFLDNVISQQEYELMRDSLLRDGELFWHFVVRFLACTGARISELRQFDVSSVEIGHLDLISKGQKLRRIYVPSKLQHDAIKWLYGEQRLNGFVFIGNTSQPMSSRGIAMGLKRFAIRYGINPDVIYPHSFRHRFAKNFIERNSDIALLADLMGHENLETTRIYLRRTALEQRQAVDSVIDW